MHTRFGHAALRTNIVTIRAGAALILFICIANPRLHVFII
jgi:hypothetical protein